MIYRVTYPKFGPRSCRNFERTVAPCDAGFGARTSYLRTGPLGAAIRTACELDERRSSCTMTSSDWGWQAVRQDLHGGAAPCETAAGSAASSLPVTLGHSDSAAAASASDTGVLHPPMLQQGSATPLGQWARDAWWQGLWQVGSTFQRFLDSK
jgi:hypothetical protein